MTISSVKLIEQGLSGTSALSNLQWGGGRGVLALEIVPSGSPVFEVNFEWNNTPMMPSITTQTRALFNFDLPPGPMNISAGESGGIDSVSVEISIYAID
jgi:hypothetical protein